MHWWHDNHTDIHSTFCSKSCENRSKYANDAAILLLLYNREIENSIRAKVERYTWSRVKKNIRAARHPIEAVDVETMCNVMRSRSYRRLVVRGRCRITRSTSNRCQMGLYSQIDIRTISAAQCHQSSASRSIDVLTCGVHTSSGISHLCFKSFDPHHTYPHPLCIWYTPGE